MKLSEYDGKYVLIKDTDGHSFSGLAKYGNTEFLECEWGLDEPGRDEASRQKHWRRCWNI